MVSSSNMNTILTMSNPLRRMEEIEHTSRSLLFVLQNKFNKTESYHNYLRESEICRQTHFITKQHWLRTNILAQGNYLGKFISRTHNKRTTGGEGGRRGGEIDMNITRTIYKRKHSIFMPRYRQIGICIYE